MKKNTRSLKLLKSFNLIKTLRKIKKINLYLILALIVLMVGLFIYNYFKFNEGFDENLIRDYINALQWSDLANIDPAIEYKVKVRNNIYELFYNKWQLSLDKQNQDTPRSEFEPQIIQFLYEYKAALDITNSYVSNVTKSKYIDALTAHEKLDNVFLSLMTNKEVYDDAKVFINLYNLDAHIYEF